MMKRKLAIPILLILSLSILSQTLIPSPAGYDSPAIFIDPASIVDEAGVLTQITIDVRTDYTGDDIWGYQFTLTYNPLILSGVSVTNGDVITTENVTFTAGTFDNAIGELGLTSALSENKTVPQPWPALNNSGPGILATVVFDVVGSGETPITLVKEDTKLKRADGTNIVDGYFNPNQLGHGYFRNVPLPITHDVATTGIAFHHSIPANTTFNGTQVLTYIDANVENEGDVPEIFNVKIYYMLASYPTIIKEQMITVSNGSTGVVTVGLNTTVFPVGYLTIIVEASAVYNELLTDNNSYNTSLMIKMTGDVQGDTAGTPGDGDVDKYDFGTFAYHYGYPYPNPRYNEECDFNRDGYTDKFDFGDLAYWYGKKITAIPPYPPL